MITGMFKGFIIFSTLILIHELGHFITGTIMGWETDKICIYPYGGCTKFKTLINTSYIEEFLVLIMGPLFQIIFYSFVKDYFSINDFLLLKKYNAVILIFNLLPIYPLDGGRLFNLMFSYFFSYKKGLYLSIIVSVIVFTFLLIYKYSISYYIVILFLINSIIREYKNIKYNFNKFLLERYIYRLRFKKIKIVNSIDSFYKNRSHIIKCDKSYMDESQVLYKYFN